MSIFDFTVQTQDGLEFEPTEAIDVEQIEEKLTGVLCSRRPTFCAYQLAKAVRAAYEERKTV